MGLIGVAVWDAEHSEGLLVRLVRGGIGPEQTKDILVKFAEHCNELKGIAHTPEEVVARWIPPPRITYTVVKPKFRVIILWNDDDPIADTASDAEAALLMLSDAVKQNVDGLLAGKSDRYYAELYRASGEALLLGEVEEIIFAEEAKKRGLRNLLNINKPDKDKGPEAAAKIIAPSRVAEKPVAEIRAVGTTEKVEPHTDSVSAKAKKKLLPFIGRGRSKKKETSGVTEGKKDEETVVSAVVSEGSPASTQARVVSVEAEPKPVVVQDEPGGSAAQAGSGGSVEVQPVAEVEDFHAYLPPGANVKGTFLDSSSEEGDVHFPPPPPPQGPSQQSPNLGAEGLHSNMGGMSLSQRSGSSTRKDLLTRVADLMTAGDFQAALATAREAIRIEEPGLDLDKAVYYAYALEIILRIRVAENQPEGQKNPLGVAFLSSALVDIPLFPRHRAGAKLMAAQKHMAVGNFGLASTYAQAALPDAEMDQQAQISQIVSICQRNGESNVRVPMSTKLCFKNFTTLQSPFLKCQACPAVFSTRAGLSPGQMCSFCSRGSVMMLG
mmetsp:Transcript_2266/g.6767  ORF Transcript_2266/g.6767 Transcript_2266/m.6767 type:complete len:552 (+) Transcript_2266:280-1935(+)|eukprot:CAMPEP_0198725670 /NCGR_PEP_ID=MMETSP1475-20131203/2929_1 /TAXON_ID= ORGANISM="Unidentified sp., Strain CCMP1999" /NCGR_SAMPLE_ID=MMETSP1475 /ASSEMBLY_ACC=CAM_ASM_001111 /LENGTH=551 /DNA_ID=CAMNT_0044487477 /DNA_START=112 /DNA_END=1767 /DNA_ORIENTATION=-